MKLLKTFVCPNPAAEFIDAVAVRIRRHDYSMMPVPVRRCLHRNGFLIRLDNEY